MRLYLNSTILVFCLFILASCGGVPKDTSEKPPLILKAESFANLPGWRTDNLQTFSLAFEKSCARILKAPQDKSFGALADAGTYGDWQAPCAEFLTLNDANNDTNIDALYTFFETRFTPHSVGAGKNPQGLFTGYYEASLNGSRDKFGEYRYPLYARPDDLVMVQLGEFREELKGRRIAGRVINGSLKPYESREDIVNGNWPHTDKVLVWVDDPVDAFFVQIQGSGVVQLADGGVMRIGYAGQNGHPYYAIGRELIERGELAKEDVSLQTIREWLGNNPDQADEIMNTNKSYVFFRTLDGEGPIGGEGVALTAGRSLAVDHSLMAYGLPIWADIDEPIDGAGDIKRLMVAQDTGGAIRGAVRGDVFWGFGKKAEDIAGPMKSKGRYWILLPN